jgi:hypothetical protein
MPDINISRVKRSRIFGRWSMAGQLTRPSTGPADQRDVSWRIDNRGIIESRVADRQTQDSNSGDPGGLKIPPENPSGKSFQRKSLF